MLSNHLQNGIIDAPKLAWSRLPNSEDAENDVVGLTKKGDEGGGVESLDYEVIENYAYWEEQVTFLTSIFRFEIFGLNFGLI